LRGTARGYHYDTHLQRRRRGRGRTHRGATRIRRYASVTSSSSTARTAASTIFGHWSPHHCRSNLVPLKLQLRIVVRAPPGSGPSPSVDRGVSQTAPQAAVPPPMGAWRVPDGTDA